MSRNDIMFTSNEEFDAIVAGDSTLEIIGYIDAIEGTKFVGQPPKTLLKFIINNDSGRRAKMLMWGRTATEYESRLINREIVKITRVKATPPNMKFWRQEETLILFELSVQHNSKIEFLGKFVDRTVKENVAKPIETVLEFCRDFSNGELISYIKVEIDDVYGNSSRGEGAIAYNIYKMRLQIVNFVKDDKLKEGVHVKVTGKIKSDKYGSDFIEVENMNNIKIIDSEVLSKRELRTGMKTPVKKSTNAVEGQSQTPPKRVRNDEADVVFSFSPDLFDVEESSDKENCT